MTESYSEKLARAVRDYVKKILAVERVRDRGEATRVLCGSKPGSDLSPQNNSLERHQALESACPRAGEDQGKVWADRLCSAEGAGV